MYHEFFKMRGSPFSIAPNPDFLFISERHKEALEHLLYGLHDTGGFVLLTGEVGTGKTTMARTLLRRLDERIHVTTLLNPQLEGTELLASVCDGFGIEYPADAGMKLLTDRLQSFLLSQDGAGHSAMLLIDEAQQLSREALELLRLLTNLETDTHKLLRIVLVGQPELNVMLKQSELRQLSQRITARYQLLPFSLAETGAYIRYRLQVVECPDDPFSEAIIAQIYHYSGGIARLINLLCDHALMAAYLAGEHRISKAQVVQSAKELELVSGPKGTTSSVATTRSRAPWGWLGAVVVVAACGFGGWQLGERPVDRSEVDTYQEQQSAHQQQWHDLAQQRSSKRWAMMELAKIWGYKVPQQQAQCSLLKVAELSCLAGESDLAGLAKLNYPVVLPLQWSSDEPHYALLRYLSDTEATLWFAGKQLVVSRDWLVAHWSGEYQLLWHSFVGEGERLQPGSKGEAVRALAQRLSLVNGQPLQPLPTIYNDTVRQQVVQFQKAHQLEADGIAGSSTLLALMQVIQPNEPTLQELSQ